MKITTFNANSIRARLDIVLNWIKENRPDILCIQETKAQDHDFPALPFIEAGYHVTFKGQKSYNGVATVSLKKPSAVSFGIDDGLQSDDARLLYTKIGPIHVVNTYVPQGREIQHPMYKYKLEWFQRLKGYFDRHFTTRMKVVWLGDLNVAAEAMDIHNAEKQTQHVCFHEDARKAFANTVEWGFTDVFRKHHPESGHYTFFDYRTIDVVKRNMGWRIDYILATPSMAKKSTDSFIDLKPRLLQKPSDHTFLTAEFNL
ncbi:MAG: exodeoxyribonuclease III [Kiritimatiellae bacterium]|nr:exodeoxyribonuclease III [Kiritimatiellia bacterium]